MAEQDNSRLDTRTANGRVPALVFSQLLLNNTLCNVSVRIITNAHRHALLALEG